MTLIESPIETAAKHYKNNSAIISKDASLSYDQLRSLVDGLLRKINELNISKEKTVALLLDDTDSKLNFIILFYALMHSGLTIFPLNFRLPPKNLLSLMKEASVETLITGRNYKTDFDKTIRQINLEELILNLKTDLNKTADLAIDEHSPLTLIATSGSTDRPKLALHTTGNYLKSAEGSNENIKLIPGDRWLLSLPLFHVGGLGILFRSLLAGAAVVLPDKELSLGENIYKYKITHLSVVFSQLQELVKQKNNKQKKWQSHLKAVLAGGGPIGNSLIKQAQEINLPIFLSYGSTEMCSQITTTDAPMTIDQINSGKTLKFREIMISDEKEILVRGKTLFHGYLIGGKILKKIDQNGWFHTCDLGKFDKHDNLTILGRMDNQFISGGENIQPEEIENQILLYAQSENEKIDDAVVVGVDDDAYGQVPFAFIKGTFDNLKLTDYLKSELPGYKLPVGFAPLPVSSDSTLQKPDRKKLKQLAEQIMTNAKS